MQTYDIPEHIHPIMRRLRTGYYLLRVALPTVLSLYDGVSTHLRQPFLQQSFLISLTFVTLLLIEALMGFNAGLIVELIGCSGIPLTGFTDEAPIGWRGGWVLSSLLKDEVDHLLTTWSLPLCSSWRDDDENIDYMLSGELVSLSLWTGLSATCNRRPSCDAKQLSTFDSQSVLQTEVISIGRINTRAQLLDEQLPLLIKSVHAASTYSKVWSEHTLDRYVTLHSGTY